MNGPRPTVGLAIAPSDDALLGRFLAALSQWAVVRQAAWDEAVDAWLVTHGVGWGGMAAAAPALVWARRAGGGETDAWPAQVTMLEPGVPSGAAEEVGRLVVPEPCVAAADFPYMPPLIRRRWRERYGLPAEMVVDLGSLRGDAATRASLAVAAVAVATGDEVLAALAWGVPTVTDGPTAQRLHLDGAVHVADERMGEAAVAVARSEQRSAELAWAGRRLVERRFDINGAAHRALQGVCPVLGDDGTHGVSSRLSELWTAPQTAFAMVHKISG